MSVSWLCQSSSSRTAKLVCTRSDTADLPFERKRSRSADAIQHSGLSPTREEYRESRECCPALIMVQGYVQL
jgi:hypothetical protein